MGPTWRLLAAASLVLSVGAALLAAPAEAKQQPLTAPTFRVYATREGLVGHRTANGHRIRPRDRFVALPSWRVLSSKGGNEFQVRVTYGGRSVVLPVWDVGPWNTRDEYWSPSRKHKDIPVGTPMAQAAFYDNYNRGRDESGRPVRAPNGIDIADGAFWDDLGMRGADWVEVTFLWLGDDPGAPAGAVEVAPTSAENPAVEPGALATDDAAGGFTSQARVGWYDELCGVGGRHRWTYGTPDAALSENRAQWATTLAGQGFYEALAYIPACGRPATESARYRVSAGGQTREVLVNQRAAGGTWVSLGVFHAGDAPATIELSDVTGDDGQVVRVDAVKWVPRADTAPPSAQVSAAQPRADGSALVQWAGADDVSGVASFDVQVRQAGGAWVEWQSGATVRQAVFVPPAPGRYAFRARARDWLGHEQPWREAEDVAVTLAP